MWARSFRTSLLSPRILIYGIAVSGLVLPRFIPDSEAAQKNAGKDELNLRQALTQAQALNEEAAKMNRAEAAMEWYAGNADDALTHLARAIHFAPQSSAAAEEAVAILSAWKMPPVLSAEFRSNSRVMSAQFSDDGNYLLTDEYLTTGKIARVWEIKSGALCDTKEKIGERDRSAVQRVTLLDGREIQFSGALGGQIKDFGILTPPPGTRSNAAGQEAPIWEKIVRGYAEAKHDSSAVFATAAFSPDHRRIVTGEEDVRVWDAATGHLLLAFNKPLLRFSDHLVMSVKYSPDGSRILSVVEKHSASVWDGATGSLVAVLSGDSAHPKRKLGDSYAAFSRDGKKIVTASVDGVIQIWTLSPPDVAPPPALPENAGPPPEWFPEFLYYMAGEQFDEDWQTYLYRGYELRSIREHLQSVLNAAAPAHSPHLDVLRYYLKYQDDNE